MSDDKEHEITDSLRLAEAAREAPTKAALISVPPGVCQESILSFFSSFQNVDRKWNCQIFHGQQWVTNSLKTVFKKCSQLFVPRRNSSLSLSHTQTHSKVVAVTGNHKHAFDSYGYITAHLPFPYSYLAVAAIHSTPGPNPTVWYPWQLSNGKSSRLGQPDFSGLHRTPSGIVSLTESFPSSHLCSQRARLAPRKKIKQGSGLEGDMRIWGKPYRSVVPHYSTLLWATVHGQVTILKHTHTIFKYKYNPDTATEDMPLLWLLVDKVSGSGGS